jgi:2-polyprenyl-3-methyl-5-hydroxy-6-metoxy-1,4-benzoquinol methylase
MVKENYRSRCYKNYVSRYWGKTHKLSKDEFSFVRKIYKKRYSNFIPEDKNTKIIDIACGSGHFLYFLQNEGYTNCSGIDISVEQIEVAKSTGVKNIHQADLFEYLPHHRESFDIIIANDIIEHLKKDEIIKFLD